MASIASYSSLISRATATDSDDDPTLIYDITDKVKGGGPDGATEVANAVRDRLVSSESHIRVRLLNLIDTLVIECGPDLHNALNQTGVFVTLADLHDKQVEAVLPGHIDKWKAEMGSTYDAVFAQAFPQRTTSSETQGGISQFKVKPVSRLRPFLTIAYFRALRVLNASRKLHIFHMQGIHIARQALHLVILLNDSVDVDPTQEQDEERIDLEDELIDLEDAIPKWAEAQPQSKEEFTSLVDEVKEQYQQFFRARFYFANARNPDQDGIYTKLLMHDQKTFRLKQWQHGLFDDDDDGRSTGFIESVHTSPALSQREVPKEEPVPLSQVDVRLDPNSNPPPSNATEQPATSTSATAAAAVAATPADQGADIEAIRRFRNQEANDQAGNQSFACPVPGCGQTFEKQHLLRHHIREHDDRPYRCPMKDCDRRFATPTEQRTHEALHRIRNLGIIPNMPSFAPPIANNPTPAPPVPEPVAVEESVAEEVKSEGKPEDIDPSAFQDDADRPLSRPEDQEEKDMSIALQMSIEDQQRQADAEQEGEQPEIEQIPEETVEETAEAEKEAE